MAELEIHHGHDHGDDLFGKRVGVIVGVIGIVLAAVTIASHRAHTEAVITRTEANDQWAYFQSKKIREMSLDIATTTLSIVAPDNPKAQSAMEKYIAKRNEYAKEVAEIEEHAKHEEDETRHIERRALHFDLGEGLLELGMVLSSLYFLSKKRFFPYIGISAAVIGTVIGIVGALI